MPRKALTETTTCLVLDFYNWDDISRMMLRKKVYVIIVDKGSKIQSQKCFILANCKEDYQLFEQKHPSQNIGVSKSCNL